MGNASLALSKGTRRWLTAGLVVGAIGVLGWLARWLMQGESVIWTDIARPFWTSDATLGWVETRDTWVWLGLDGLALAAVVVLGTLATFALSRAASGRLGRLLRGSMRVGAGVALLAPVFPAWAFATGFPPDGAERLLPVARAAAAATTAPDADVANMQGDRAAAVGHWRVAGEVAATLLVARIAAGGEEFDAKLAPVSGDVSIDGQPTASTARLSVPAGSIATGVELRDRHARGYLESDTHAAIGLTVSALESFVFDGATASYRARATLALLGRELPVTATGTLSVLDAAHRTELGVTSAKALLATTTFTVPIAATGLDRANFDADQITISGRFVLVPAE